MPKVGTIIVLDNTKRVDPNIADRNCTTDMYDVSVVVRKETIGLRIAVVLAVLFEQSWCIPGPSMRKRDVGDFSLLSLENTPCCRVLATEV
jgi:hypothetical protein